MAFLFKRNNGVYYAVCRDSSRVVWQSLRTRDEAEATEKFQLIKPSLECQRPVTLEQLVEAILKYSRVNHRKGTSDIYRVALQHLVACLGNKPLRFITPMDGEKFKEYLLNHE